MSEIVQIVIIRSGQPIDTPEGEVFKVIVFNRKEVVDSWIFSDIDNALGEVKNQMEDLVSA